MFPGAPASENRKEATLPEPAKKRPRIQESRSSVSLRALLDVCRL
ncbi:unnamed protein product [Onchocerca flexuosa]|uniref:Uncharacterized protein n=1 Tax=Onchocerca flexuosa TaxID=387005 RepID=A0A183HEA4_9BILA|nr:unnamed protein product [Onchocerca flexuosa]